MNERNVTTQTLIFSLGHVDVKLLLSDKEGGSVVVPAVAYYLKVEQALSSHFTDACGVKLAKVKAEATKFHESSSLTRLAASVMTSKGATLTVLFFVKTRKVETPFHVIVSEQCTWQQLLGVFLQKLVGNQEVDNPLLIRKPHQLSNFLQSECPPDSSALPVDVNDLYYSLPSNLILEEVGDCIEKHWVVTFQNAYGKAADSFMEMLTYSLNLASFAMPIGF